MICEANAIAPCPAYEAKLKIGLRVAEETLKACDRWRAARLRSSGRTI
jgi:hypothetical protein